MNLELKTIGELNVKVESLCEALDELKTEIRQEFKTLKNDLQEHYVTDKQLELELRNLRDSFEPTKKTVNDVVSQIIRYMVGAIAGIAIGSKFL